MATGRGEHRRLQNIIKKIQKRGPITGDFEIQIKLPEKITYITLDELRDKLHPTFYTELIALEKKGFVFLKDGEVLGITLDQAQTVFSDIKNWIKRQKLSTK